MQLFQVFFVFLKTGFFAVGGAYSFLPLLEKELVDRYQWLTKEEFLEVLGMVKVFPGAISVKYATYTGYKIAGVWGLIAANFGNLLAPILLVVFASFLYTKYKDLPSVRGAFNMIQIAAFAMIISVAFQLIDGIQLMQWRNILVILICLSLLTITKIHPAWIIIGAGIIGAVFK